VSAVLLRPLSAQHFIAGWSLALSAEQMGNREYVLWRSYRRTVWLSCSLWGVLWGEPSDREKGICLPVFPFPFRAHSLQDLLTALACERHYPDGLVTKHF